MQISVEEIKASIIEAFREAAVPKEYVYAFIKIGLLVTEENIQE
ncbi:MAG TPA: hypothetical protein PKW50_04665 [Syntrophomonas sp.]|nr:hypothetical protein [Syntrophomonas sp.]